MAARIASLKWRLRRMMLCEVAVDAHPPDANGEAAPRFGFVDRTELPKLRKDLAFTELMLARRRRLRALLAGLSGAADGDRMTGDDALELFDAAGLVVPWPPDEGCRPGLPNRNPVLYERRRELPPDLYDEGFRTAVGLPEEWLERADEWDGWTAGAVRRGLERLAAWGGWSADRLLAEMGDIDIPAQEKAVADKRAELEPVASADLGRRVVPPDAVLNVVQRYESHLSRQLSQALDHLERARALRWGR